MSKLQDINNKLNALKKQATEQFSEAFLEHIRPVFEKYPELESFGFRGWVPYFSDGEECVFGLRAYSDAIEINGEEGFSAYSKNKDWRNDAASDLDKIINEIDDSLFQQALGNHFQVTVTREKVNVSEYRDHD